MDEDIRLPPEAGDETAGGAPRRGEPALAEETSFDGGSVESVTVNLEPRRRPGQAELHLLATRRAGGGADQPPPDRYGERGWVALGEKVVGFGVDRDVINIGQSEEWFRNRAFRSLHLVAERNDVHMMNLRIVYLNGVAEDLRVDRLIRAGTDLAVDLRGDRSYIARVEMTYRSRPNFRGQAVVRVYGELDI